MSVKKQEGLPTTKIVARGLRVSAGTVAAAATLVFVVAGGLARADDAIPILDGIKHQILSSAQLDQVHGSFTVYGTNLQDNWGFLAFYNVNTGTYVENSSNPRQWQWLNNDPSTDTLVHKDRDGNTTVLMHDSLNYFLFDRNGTVITHPDWWAPPGG